MKNLRKMLRLLEDSQQITSKNQNHKIIFEIHNRWFLILINLRRL